jgi:hypothetical protein
MIRSKLQYITAAIIVIIALINVGAFIQHFTAMPPRQSDGMTVQENRFRWIRVSLLGAHYSSGNVGYMPAGVLEGRARRPEEDVTWVEGRYAMIPFNLQQDTLDAPFVILDVSGSKGSANIPDGFSTVYGPVDGLILLERKARQ